jgi:hypothetical protein
MLQPSQMTPTVPAYASLWKQHDYNANPFAPLECKVEAHLVPTICESWAPHTARGFYVVNAFDHYWCHEIYITDTKHSRVCNAVFFKHKYLTMPTITPVNALIRAVDDLTDAISGIIPPPSTTREAVDQLMLIFKQQAKKAKDNATTQRVLKECAQAERVRTKEDTIETPTAEPSNEPTTAFHNMPITTFPHLEVEYPDIDVGIINGRIPLVSQDDNNGPAANTPIQWQRQTITQDYLFSMLDIPGITKPFTNRQASLRKFPLQFLCDFAYAVLDDKTGNLLEYCHLLKHPKCKDVWSKLFGTEI